MSLFNLKEQNQHLEFKIVAGLERLSQVFKILLWEKAKKYQLSPIQIQILIFIRYHSTEKTTISYLAQEFNLTKPTVSDAIKVLEQKQFIQKNIDVTDSRSYTIELTKSGIEMVENTDDFANPMNAIIEKATEEEKKNVWKIVSNLIIEMNKLNLISIQRTCLNCKHYSFEATSHFCHLLNQELKPEEIRIDCDEFE